jgi:thioredoxin reductase (NADPH)
VKIAKTTKPIKTVGTVGTVKMSIRNPTLDNFYSADIAIIGAGPVGLFSVFQAGMLGMSSVVIDALSHIGGQCTALYPEKPIYDIPAYTKISAANLISNLDKQNSPFKPKYMLDQVVNLISVDEKSHWILRTSQDNYIKSKAVIIAAGCGAFKPNMPPLEGIDEFENKTVFYNVGNTDIFKGKKIVIAGGGDSALDWALSLAEIADKIYIVHRRRNFKAMDNTVKKIEEISTGSGVIEFIIPYQLYEIHGEFGILHSIDVINLEGDIMNLKADYLLPFFGLKMDLGPIIDWQLNLNKNHITVNPENMMTNLEGIFAIGDVSDYPGKLKLILTGFSEAAVACHNAYKYVFPDKALHFVYSTNNPIIL